MGGEVISFDIAGARPIDGTPSFAFRVDGRVFTGKMCRANSGKTLATGRFQCSPSTGAIHQVSLAIDADGKPRDVVQYSSPIFTKPTGSGKSPSATVRALTGEIAAFINARDNVNRTT